ALTALIVAADLWLPFPTLLSLLTLPVILAITMISFRGVLIIAIIVISYLCMLITSSAGARVAEASVMVATLVAVIALVYLWHRRSMQLIDWSWQHYQHAQSALERARDESMEHRQLEADLILANNELARLTVWLKSMHQLAEEMRQTKE